MKSIILNLTLICLCFSSINAQNNEHRLSLDDFKSTLKKDMNNKTIVETFGQPDYDIGSGIYIYVYKLFDSTTMIIGCTNKVFYANHCDKQGDLLQILIGDSKLKCNPASLKNTYIAILQSGIKQKEAIINDKIVFTVKSGQLILYNDYAHTAWISDCRYGYIPPDDLVKVDTFYFKFDFSEKDFTLDSENELLIATKRQGIDINKITYNVTRKDSKTLFDLFILRDKFDGAAAEIYPHHFWTLLTLWNDKEIADFIINLSLINRKKFVDYISDSYVTFQIEKPLIYYELYYPETFELIKKYK